MGKHGGIIDKQGQAFKLTARTASALLLALVVSGFTYYVLHVIHVGLCFSHKLSLIATPLITITWPDGVAV